jgi:hypothetical protein
MIQLYHRPSWLQSQRDSVAFADDSSTAEGAIESKFGAARDSECAALAEDVRTAQKLATGRSNVLNARLERAQQARSALRGVFS